MKGRSLAVAVFRSIASSQTAGTIDAAGSDRRGDHDRSGSLAQIIAEVSVDFGEGALVARERMNAAMSLLATTRFIEADDDTVRITREGEQIWRRVSHLPPAGIKKWIREAVEVYSRGEQTRWEVSDQVWADADARFHELARTGMVERLEVLDGLLTAIDNWHFVSTLIRSAADRSAAIAALEGCPFAFTELQALHILDVKLTQRTALGRLSLSEERDAIQAELGKVGGDIAERRLDWTPGSAVIDFHSVEPGTRVAG